MTTTTTSGAVVPGRFEVPFEKFEEMTAGKGADVQHLDLSEVLPDFAGGKQLPRLVSRVWRRSCDEVFAENRGMYCVHDGVKVRVFFFELTGAVCKAKVAIIKSRIPGLLKAAQNDEGVLDAPLPQGKAASAPAEKGNQELAKLMKEGLPENPSIEAVGVWCARARQEMTMSAQKVPLTREMIELAGKSDFSCLPLWSPAAEAVVGSFVRVKSGVPQQQWHTGEAARLDLAAFFGAAFQLYSMQSKGISALVVVPVRVGTLADKEAFELYTGLLRRLAPEVRKNLVVSVCNVPKDAAPASLVAAVETVGQFAKAVMFETGIVAYSAFGKQFPKLHASGFDSEDAHIGEHEQARLMKKYAEHYGAAGLKVFARNVSSPHVAAAAIENKYAYISGTAIRPAQKTCFAMQKLPKAELKLL